jgi:type VI secretion system secreted protein Hcp
MKTLDKASPKLALACADGTHIKEIIVEFCRAGGEKLKYMEYKLSNCIISCIAVHGGGEGEPMESVRFNYGKIEWTYTKQNRSDGSGGGNVAAGWNRQGNKAV